MPKKDKVDAKAAAKAGKAARKKWSKGNVKDKLVNKVVLDQETYDKLMKDVPTYKLITPSVISDRLKINGSLARRALKELEKKGLIKCVVRHSAQSIYTRSVEKSEAAADDKAKAAAAKPAKKAGGKKQEQTEEAKQE